ncbi:hypothetical protein Gpo141_00000918 [Globisporangium polare]
MSAAPHLVLEDVARDGFRRKFFLSAFGDEKDALELCFAFLGHVRKYKTLVGRKELLQNIAKELVAMYLSDPTQQLRSVYLAAPDVQQLMDRVVDAVAHDRSPLDLFAGLEERVKQRLSDDKFPQFLASDQYTQLCEAIREKRELPLGEVLAHQRRTRYLEAFLATHEPASVGNLRFWVDVQTLFLPLIQTNMFSVALFEEIQTTLRRLYNTYLTESSPSAATLLTEEVRKDTLKKIMMLQGEPFSPPRYASLFRRAQEQVWEWLQTDVYHRFKRSRLYVLLVVEIENLESDHQLRRLSEQVHQQQKHARNLTSAAAFGKKNEPKSSAIVVPVTVQQGRLATSTSTHSRFEVQRPTVLVSEFKRELQLDELSDTYGLESICFHSLVETPSPVSDSTAAVDSMANGSSRFVISCDLFCGNRGVSFTSADHLAYWWNRQTIPTLPAVLSPSHRVQQAPPKPSIHDFLIPNDDGNGDMYGACLTRWHVAASPSPFQDPLSSRDVNATSGTSFAFEASPSDEMAQHCHPSFVSVTSAKPMHRRARLLLQQLASQDPETITIERLRELLASLPKVSSRLRVHLNARHRDFYLHKELSNDDFPLHWVFKELSTQHFFQPFCPIGTANRLSSEGLFTANSKSPFIIGFEGALTYQKQKEKGADQRHRIRNSIYNAHKVSLRLGFSALKTGTAGVNLGPTSYPKDILQSHAVVLDIDNDDLYLPGKLEVPEFPLTVVRCLEGNVKEVLARQQILNADTQLFQPKTHSSFIDEMVEPRGSDGPATGVDGAATLAVDMKLDHGARLAFMSFLEALFGDVVYHFCSFAQDFAADELLSAPTQQPEKFLVFEVDSFLDAHVELGCREFFRQCFQTELFRNFLLRQHAQFALVEQQSTSAQ